MQNINRVNVSGNLTRDPERRETGSGLAVAEMRVAVNGRRKDPSAGWVDDPNFFDVVAFGTEAEACLRYLSKGKGVIIDGRLNWREWVARDGSKRQSVDIIADRVQFAEPPPKGAGGSDRPTYDDSYAPSSARPVETHGAEAAPASPAPAYGTAPSGGGRVGPDDDIPFAPSAI